MSLFRFVVAATALGLLAGCGPKGPRKVPVSGTVTLDGKPLNQGEIYFITPGVGTPPECLQVADGKFAGQVTLGKKRVAVSSAKKMGNASGMSMGKELILNRVADDYSVNSKLTAEVSDSGLNPSTFDVKENKDAR